MSLVMVVMVEFDEYLDVARWVAERHTTLRTHKIRPLEIADDARGVGYPRVADEREDPACNSNRAA